MPPRDAGHEMDRLGPGSRLAPMRGSVTRPARADRTRQAGPPRKPSWKKTGLYPRSETHRIAASIRWGWSGM